MLSILALTLISAAHPGDGGRRVRVATVGRAVDLSDPALAKFIDPNYVRRLSWVGDFGEVSSVKDVHARWLARETRPDFGTSVARDLIRNLSYDRVELVPLPDVPPGRMTMRLLPRLARAAMQSADAASVATARRRTRHIDDLTTLFTRDGIRIVNLHSVPRESHSLLRHRPFVRAYLARYADFAAELARRNPNVVFVTADRGGRPAFARLNALPNVIVTGESDRRTPLVARYVIRLLIADPDLRGPAVKLEFLKFLNEFAADHAAACGRALTL